MDLISFGDNGWGDELFVATLMTVAVAITAMLIGFLFALIFTPLKLSKYKILNLIANFYTTVVRGVPELLVIYLFFLEEVVQLCMLLRFLVIMIILKSMLF